MYKTRSSSAAAAAAAAEGTAAAPGSPRRACGLPWRRTRWAAAAPLAARG
ncbi:unnamed protein product [Spirodela intermedia]|uniref:Uncharacterized protein n=1 Tax=Spirodela intermedia TaxID=51605 RepID=A0A7I8JB79_SPIIN|nr:unnamed protein product [Spirodela intermedia]CAA6667427.1 unnamed protein product [Spirodela intermedia]